MNERIQELSEQAGYTLVETKEWPEVYVFNKEKFAELIIKECADIALREDHDPYECILNHFGVKE
jgi:hypothetical protein